MSKHNSRKEPTFGEPKSTQTEIDFSEPAEQAHLPKVSISLHSKQKPSYTFSSVLKRPAELAKDFATFEEMSMLQKEKASEVKAEREVKSEHIEEQPVALTQATQPEIESLSSSELDVHQSVHQQPSIVNLQATPESKSELNVAAEPETPVLKVRIPAAEQTTEPLRNEPPLSLGLESMPKSSDLAFTPIIEKDEIPTVTLNEPARSSHTSTVAVGSDFERVIPTAGYTVPKEPPQKRSSSYLRLLIVLLLIAALGLLFFFLKPSAPQTVEEQPQSTINNLPIEFRPMNEEEAKRAEANAIQQSKAEVEANARMQAQQQIDQARAQIEAQIREKQLAEQQALQAQQQALQAQQQAQLQAQQAKARAEAEAQAKLQAAQQAKARAEAEAKARAEAEAQARLQAQQAKARAEAEAQAKLQAQQFKDSAPQQQVQTEPTVNPSRNGSVIYQPEGAVKPVDNKTPKLAQSGPTKVQANELDRLVNQLGSVNNKPVQRAEVNEPSIKVFVVQRGVSVMQLFREYNLDISDVNAMNRANKILSNLKAGEKLTVKLDKNNHVEEMILSSGGRFIRQANGTYLYK